MYSEVFSTSNVFQEDRNSPDTEGMCHLADYFHFFNLAFHVLHNLTPDWHWIYLTDQNGQTFKYQALLKNKIQYPVAGTFQKPTAELSMGAASYLLLSPQQLSYSNTILISSYPAAAFRPLFTGSGNIDTLTTGAGVRPTTFREMLCDAKRLTGANHHATVYELMIKRILTTL